MLAKILSNSVALKWLFSSALIVGASAGALKVGQKMLTDQDYVSIRANHQDLKYNPNETAIWTVTKLKEPTSPDDRLYIETFFQNAPVEVSDTQGVLTYQKRIENPGNYEFKVRVFIEHGRQIDAIRKTLVKIDRQLADLQEQLDAGSSDPQIPQEIAKLTALKQSLNNQIQANRIYAQEKAVSIQVIDPRPRVQFATASQSVTVGATGTFSIQVNLDRAPNHEIHVPYVVSGTSPSSDTTLETGEVVFPVGSTSQTISFNLKNTAVAAHSVTLTLQSSLDSVAEGLVTHTISLVAPAGPGINVLTVSVLNEHIPSYAQITMRGIPVDDGYSKLKIDFGDGKTAYQTIRESITAAQSNSNGIVRHLYQQAGSYTLKVTLVRPDGSEGPVKTLQFAISDSTRVIPQIQISQVPGQPMALKFDVTGVPGVGSGTRFEWLFGDGSAEQFTTNPSITHNFSAPIPFFNVRFRAVRTNLQRSEVTIRVDGSSGQASVPSPVVVLKTTNFVGQAPYTVTFDASGSFAGEPGRSISAVRWDFGGFKLPFYRQLAMGPTATYTYTKPGVYFPVVTVLDDQTPPKMTTQGLVVIVTDPSPPATIENEIIAISGSPSNPDNTEGVNFVDLNSVQPILADNVNSYWELGNGFFAVGRAAAAVYMSPSSSQTYDIKQNTIDIYGERRTSTRAIVFGAGKTFPTSSYNNSSPWVRTEPGFIQAIGSDPLNLPLQFKIDFGDGAITAYSPLPAGPMSHTYMESGIFSAATFVTNSEGRSAVSFLPVTVQNTPNIDEIRVNADVYSAAPGEVINFSVDSDLAMGNFYWDLGDGIPSSAPGNPPAVARGSSIENNFGYRFSSEGVYTVFQVTTDSRGNKISNSIRVAVVSHTSINPEPIAAFSVIDQSGLKVRLNGDNSTSSGPIITYAWNWGDGKKSAFTGSQSFHTYSSPGTYHVTLTVYDQFGGSDSVTSDVTVSAPLAHSPENLNHLLSTFLPQVVLPWSGN